MSQENVEVIRRAIESLNATKVDPACYDPEVEYTTQPDSPNYMTYRGVAGLKRSLQSVSEAWSSIEAEAREFIQGDEVIVALVHFRLRGHSGVELEVDQGWAWWMRDGKIRRVEQYGTKREALEAAGLKE
jgi:ketosteroid isomerase-like protein